MDTLSVKSNYMKRSLNYRLDSEWWDYFLEKTADLRRPAICKNVLSGDERNWFEQALLELVSTRTRDDSQKLRLYIEGNLMNTGYLYDNFFPNLPDGRESILQWLQRTFGDVKFALLINNCELMNDTIPTAVVRYLSPLLEKTGLPCNGLQIDAIIGNYGYTPFGIHRDNIGDAIFHFHLGPAPKHMYTWETGYYLNTLHGRQNEQDIESFIPFANKFEITEGDVYYMPWTEYHVGYTPEISMSVTVTIQSGIKTNLVSNMLKQLSADLLVSADQGHLASEKTPSSPRAFSRLDKELDRNPLWNEYSFYDALKLTYDKFLLKLGSNCGMHAGVSARGDQNPIERTGDWFKDRSISVNDPFPIFWREHSEGLMEIYARGHDFVLAKETLVETMIRRLNDGGPYSYSSLLENTGEGNSEKRALELLNRLYALKAIVVE